ncbi:MAG: thiosulfate oxidation carrier complex protein SoxZ [Proteobacteria bacterium]|nr:thiosulfate oxidation carrier complex protein SoxZ [Pseudomonadota bacterium]
MAKARVKAPKSVKKGEVFEVKALISHNMETGLRKDKKTGKTIPRKIINKLSVTYGGKEVFGSDWHPAVSANPYVSFFVRASESGPIKFVWTEDGGGVTEKSVDILVA